MRTHHNHEWNLEADISGRGSLRRLGRLLRHGHEGDSPLRRSLASTHDDGVQAFGTDVDATILELSGGRWLPAIGQPIFSAFAALDGAMCLAGRSGGVIVCRIGFHPMTPSPE